MTNVLFCETQTLLRSRHGRRGGPPASHASVQGEREHERHDRNARRFHQRPATEGDRRCFIASAVYGADAWQVDTLRHYRDSVLLRSWHGRAAVCLYYRLSPAIVRVVHAWPWLARSIKRQLDAVVSRLDRDWHSNHE